jgi:hypothetical protein
MERVEDEKRTKDLLGMLRAAAELVDAGRVVARFEVASYAAGDEGRRREIALREVSPRLEALGKALDGVAAVEQADAKMKEQLEERWRSIREEWQEKCKANDGEGVDRHVHRPDCYSLVPAMGPGKYLVCGYEEVETRL